MTAGSTETTPATHKSPLHDFLAPDSIAIIGASADPTKRGYKAMVGLIKGNYRGKIYPLNPKVPEILGVPTYAALDDIPGPVDLALICTPAATLNTEPAAPTIQTAPLTPSAPPPPAIVVQPLD